jgi:hypothetical protein
VHQGRGGDQGMKGTIAKQCWSRTGSSEVRLQIL